MAEESNNNVRRCGQIGDGDDDELSMVDVLNEQARLQADANAVLGGSDEKNCTYPRGYLKRQAMYACATCTPDGNAGICLACSYACHEGHDLYELYTKRFFRCDCGNEKFGVKKCTLYKDDKTLNARNRYSQNFRGVYCTCHRPYPDPEDAVEDEMIQCIMCEDWYHGRHLKASVPESNDFQEMTCPGCMSKFAFLWAYNVPGQVTPLKKEDTSGDVNTLDVSGITDDEKSESTVAGTPSKPSPVTQSPDGKSDRKEEREGTSSSQEVKENGVASPSHGVKRERTTNESNQAPSPKKARLEKDEPNPESLQPEDDRDGQCILKSLENRVVDHPDCAAFWPDGWREKLCKCDTCMDIYKDRDIEFLIDEADTVHAYEQKGRDSAGNESDEESEASALAGMGRVQQIEMVRGYMDLKTELNEFLHEFAREGKVVTETDVREFFQRMEARKRDRMHIPQHSCR